MTNREHKILLLAGDGIGPEVTACAERIIQLMNDNGTANIKIEKGLIGGASYDACGTPLDDETLVKARQCDSALMGAVGAPQYEKLDRSQRPEQGLLKIRSELDLFANLRPVVLFDALSDQASIKEPLIKGLDVMIVRELVGGIYFGSPRGVYTDEQGRRVGHNTMIYREDEIERIMHSAFTIARKRKCRLCSVDKANVLEVSGLWREVAIEVGTQYSDVELSHLYVDNAAMQLASRPTQFDVIVTSNLFGDILSDLAAMLTGSIGMLPSASLNADQWGLYEPVHGSAPDIAGQQKANPSAMILSLAMLLRYSLSMPQLAERLEQAVAMTLCKVRTADIAGDMPSVTTDEFTEELGNQYLNLIK